MNGLKSRKREDLQKPFSCCTERMINVFDMNTGMGGTKQLNDRAHRDGSPSRRNRSEAVKKPLDPVVVYVEDKQVTSEMRKSSSCKKSGGTPMKMLIAQEMSKEVDSKRKQPNVVARLMGLDEALPAHPPVQNGEALVQKSGRSSRVTLAGALQNSRERKDSYVDRSRPWEVRSCAQDNEYRDVYEVWQQPKRTSHLEDYSLQRARQDDMQNEMRMALVRQKFMEAKRLATDERLLQSREFQDALEVLSSNKDLFLQFLEEPNSLFSKHLKELHSTPAAPQAKRITVLKPSRTLEMKGDAHVKKHLVNNEGGRNLDRTRRSSSMTQPTRIVILKPSPGKRHDTKPLVMPHIGSPEPMEKDDLDHALKPIESIDSREAAKDITQQMRDSVCSMRRDESLLSSILSNGYVGDESSFNRSENEYGGEEEDNFSDSEIPSPTSRHSWDYSNRFGSPYSFSSFSRASYSPEPSVIREAKKRLSERWSLVASNGNSQEQMEVRRSSSTLGEMLAIPEVKKEVRVGALTVSSRSCGGEEDLRVSSASSATCQTKDGDCVERSPGNLPRSKSLPVSSASEKIGLNLEISNARIQNPVIAKDAAKSKSGKSSFKGKVSSLFFSRNKKSDKEKSISSPPVVGSNGVGKGGNAEHVDKESGDLLHPLGNNRTEGFPLVSPDVESLKESSPASANESAKQGTLPFRAVLSIDKASTIESLTDNQSNPSFSNKIGENLNQPSPTSVLDAPFEDDTNNATPSSSEKANAELSLAPIESLARTLSWDDTSLEISSPDSVKLATTLKEANAEEQQRHLFVQNILSTAGLEKNCVFDRWYSVDRPLDPILLNKFLDRKEEDAKSRERRSSQRLLFDCINSALLEIGKTAYSSAYPWASSVCGWRRKKSLSSISAGDEVWVLISDWFSSEVKFDAGEIDSYNLVVDRLLRREVGGNGWDEAMHSEIEGLGKEITGRVFEELVGEVLADLTVGCL